MNAELQDDILERENVAIGQQEENSCESRSKRRKRRGKWNKEAIIAIILALIPVIGFLIFNGFPLVISFLALFCDVDLYELGSFSWNNFEGFKVIFSNDYSLSTYGLNVAHYFYKACGITLWIASTQFVTLLIALGIAVLLATKVKGHNVFQILFFVPYIQRGRFGRAQYDFRNFDHMAERSVYDDLDDYYRNHMASARLRNRYV